MLGLCGGGDREIRQECEGPCGKKRKHSVDKRNAAAYTDTPRKEMRFRKVFSSSSKRAKVSTSG